MFMGLKMLPGLTFLDLIFYLSKLILYFWVSTSFET